MKIILTGASGLIGSRFEELLFDKHEIIPMTSRDADITVQSSVSSFFSEHDADVVIHLAGKTDVDSCEVDKAEDIKSLQIEENQTHDLDVSNTNKQDWDGKNSAFAINFIGTRNIYDEAKKRNIKFVYISTDFVFKGEYEYDESSNPDPINWYGMTKWYGEKVVDVSNNLIVRLSFPYGYPSLVKPDFVQKIIGLLRDRDEVSLIEDQTITPTFVDDIVYGLEFLLDRNQTGIYHLSGSSSDTPFSIGQRIKEKYGFSTSINPTTREQIYAGKAPRPFKSILKNDKLRSLGFIPKTFDEGLELIK